MKAVVAYATKPAGDILLFDDCLAKGKKLTLYGRVDGSCPIGLRILDWLSTLYRFASLCPTGSSSRDHSRDGFSSAD
jgi:hypothetical protein